MKDLSLDSLKEFLGDLSKIDMNGWVGGDVKTPFQTKPCDFLRFAEYDLNNKYEHHLINALSNVKRALDCQLDSLLIGFGFYNEAKKKKLTFPKKVALMDSLGIVSPRILKRINNNRNLLEHEYISPKEVAVEDALDVATLFVAYTDKFIQNALTGGEPQRKNSEEWIDIKLDYEKKSLSLSLSSVGATEGTKTIKAEDPEYLDYLKLFLGLYKLM